MYKMALWQVSCQEFAVIRHVLSGLSCAVGLTSCHVVALCRLYNNAIGIHCLQLGLLTYSAQSEGVQFL